MARRPRWRGAVVAAVTLAGAGVWAGDGTLLLAATIPLAYLGYGSVSTVRVPDGLAVERSVDPSPAPPGRPVSVELTLTNESDRRLADVRVVDRPPADLAVHEGSPRAGVTLDAGERHTVEYTLIARRGEYEFQPPRLRVRGAGAGAMATAERRPRGESRLVCRLDAEAPPLSDEGADGVGQLTSDEPGSGLTFHSTREYQHGDAATRINWRQYAKQGELATVNYKRWVSTTVVFVLDARERSRVAAGPGRPTAIELGAYATTQAATSLLAAGHDVAVAVVGVDGDGPARLAWLPPGGGRAQRGRAIAMLAEASELPPAQWGTDDQFRKVPELAGPGSQLVLVSPALDGRAVEALSAWAAFEYPRTLLSPDVVSTNTVGGQYQQVRRRTRLARAQATGARTIDWRRGTPLQLVLEYAFAVEARRGPVAAGGVE